MKPEEKFETIDFNSGFALENGELDTTNIGVAIWDNLADSVIDYDSMVSDYGKHCIAAAACAAFERFMLRPDARAMLDAERKRLIAEGSKLLQ
ncbi:MAG: hypothetical protein FWC20_00760 [Oscillospiraceae bacterium]|nr:hypothetical protein [Oscillospiraceae bacterium]MCL2277924.1 hypothetical protein [Oscillospiraceae bacterium]